MTLVIGNRIRATTATAGTGPVEMGSAVPGFRAWSVLPAGASVPYVIEDGDKWEMGHGTWDGARLTRSPHTSSAGGGPIELSGSAVVAVTLGAQDVALLDDVNALRDEVENMRDQLRAALASLVAIAEAAERAAEAA